MDFVCEFKAILIHLSYRLRESLERSKEKAKERSAKRRGRSRDDPGRRSPAALRARWHPPHQTTVKGATTGVDGGWAGERARMFRYTSGESRGILKICERYTSGSVRIDAGLFVGLTTIDPTDGSTAGFTYVFNAFTVPKSFAGDALEAVTSVVAAIGLPHQNRQPRRRRSISAPSFRNVSA